MDLIAASTIHCWENISLVEKEVAADTPSVVLVENELKASYFSLPILPAELMTRIK